MAPSRAFLRRIASASTPPHIRPTPRHLSTSTVRLPKCSVRLLPQQEHLSSRTSYPARTCVRSYSQQSSVAPEPPDYLNEAELHIFNKIKGELEPAKLEVRIMPTVLLSRPRNLRDGALHSSLRLRQHSKITISDAPIATSRACEPYQQCGLEIQQDRIIQRPIDREYSDI